MAKINDSIIHLTMRFGTQVLSIGTGLLYLHKEKYYIVTAWHNLTGLNSETLEPISRAASVPDNILASMVIRYPGELSIRQSAVISLQDEKTSLFLIHPKHWPNIDVAVIPVDFETAEQEVQTFDRTFRRPFLGGLHTERGTIVLSEICPVQNYLLSSTVIKQRWLSEVQVSQELFIPGYPQNITDRSLQPVWKRATIASGVQAGWNGERKFLIDSASQSGMSGAPVFLYAPDGKVRLGAEVYHAEGTAAVLAGIYVGRVGVTEKVDPQIGIVFHASVIDEIIEADYWAPLPQDVEVSNSDLEAAILHQLSTASRDGISNINNEAMPSRFYVRNAVIGRIDGKASPRRVLNEILALAKGYNGPYAED